MPEIPKTSYYYFSFNKTNINNGEISSDDDVLQIRCNSFPLSEVKRIFLDRGYTISITNVMEIDKEHYKELLGDKEFEAEKYEDDDYEGIYLI